MKIGTLVVALSAYDRVKVTEKLLEGQRAELDRALDKLDEEQRAAFALHESKQQDLIAKFSGGEFCRRDS